MAGNVILSYETAGVNGNRQRTFPNSGVARPSGREYHPSNTSIRRKIRRIAVNLDMDTS
mgnify:CR=1 FL=1